MTRKDAIAHHPHAGREPGRPRAKKIRLWQAAHPAMIAPGKALKGDRRAGQYHVSGIPQVGQGDLRCIQGALDVFRFAGLVSGTSSINREMFHGGRLQMTRSAGKVSFRFVSTVHV